MAISAYKQRPCLTVSSVTLNVPVRYFGHRRVVSRLRVIFEEKHMKTGKLLPAMAVVAAALFSSSSFADNADVRFSIGDVSFGIGIGTPPPAPIVEYVPVALPGHVWMPGYWAWNGHRHVWTSGAWAKGRPGYNHVAGYWEQRGNRWHFEPSRWETHKSAAHYGERHGYARQVQYEEHRGHGYWRNHESRRD
jgi:hypothetical protein